MIVVAIIGVLAAVAIPAFTKYIAKSKTSEAKTFIKRIYDGARVYYMEPNYGTKSVTPVAPQFPGNDILFGAGSGGSFGRASATTGATIMHWTGGACCAVSNGVGNIEKCGQTSSFWETTAWKALQFSVEDPAFYAYGYWRGDPVVTGQTGFVMDGFTASALGDLDCDSTRSQFAMFGWVTPDTDGPAGTSSISKWNELE